jgi:hypothetical protein
MELRGRNMSKAFWEGFWQGFGKASVIGLPAAVAFVIGLTLGSWSHPYEQCKRMYNTPEDIDECVWIRMNP